VHCQPPAGAPIQAGDDGSFRIEPSDDPPVPHVRRYATGGWLRTVALDSGADDCQWPTARCQFVSLTTFRTRGLSGCWPWTCVGNLLCCRTLRHERLTVVCDELFKADGGTSG